ncbi:hypothetical protein X772_04115 [Mesorhizobium sp. LSJC280B00]|nr:hypothetical protein X772_04115 [Mesorhizobium sp. LSJC280B00]
MAVFGINRLLFARLCQAARILTSEEVSADGEVADLPPRGGDVAEGDRGGRDVLTRTFTANKTGWRSTRDDPLWPAGHLPLKEGD